MYPIGTALNSRNPWVGLFSGPRFVLPGLCDKVDQSSLRWLLTHVREGEGEDVTLTPTVTGYIDSVTPSGRAAEGDYAFHLWLKSLQARPSPRQLHCVTGAVRATPPAAPCSLPWGRSCCHDSSPVSLQRCLGPRYLEKEGVRVFCCEFPTPGHDIESNEVNRHRLSVSSTHVHPHPHMCLFPFWQIEKATLSYSILLYL